MKKLTVYILLLNLLSLEATSQTLFFESFDSLTSGNKLAQTAGSPWTTWNNLPGGQEDPVITADTSFSANNSIFITDSNDCVLLLGNKTTGNYRIDFELFVHSDNTAYFSVLQEFNSNYSNLGLQVFFQNNGTALVDAGQKNITSFSYTSNKWMHFRIFVDLDNDFASLIKDNQRIINWTWSTGAFGDNNLLKLDAVNFYGWYQEDTSGYYIDDVTFTLSDTLNAPQNLTALTTNNNIVLNWDAPAGDSLTSYAIFRNNALIASNITTNTFSDNTLKPGIYSYRLKAFYVDYGYSHFSNEAGDTVFGGVPRNLVVFETGTGTWCEYCQGVAMGLQSMVDSNQNIAIINYHFIDDYENEFSLHRLQYYGIEGYPTTIIDGHETILGGSTVNNLYQQFLQAYQAELDIPALYSINLETTQTDDTIFNVSVNLLEEYAYFTDNLKLRATLTQSNIEDNWLSLTEINNNCIGMFPGVNGTDLDFTTDSVQNIQFSFVIDSVEIENIPNYELIVYVQEEITKEILQATAIKLKDVKATTVEKTDKPEMFKIIPNPAANNIYFNELDKGEVYIYSVNGQLQSRQIINFKNQRINISNLKEGVYVVKIQRDNSLLINKLLIRR
ncbi:MAG: T9SS type A sorting domain-containing protein [Chlorobi bacterium]|nr:T9SS type A sorting domain-containing protein [Chlorobiota bacterium]